MDALRLLLRPAYPKESESPPPSRPHSLRIRTPRAREDEGQHAPPPPPRPVQCNCSQLAPPVPPSDDTARELRSISQEGARRSISPALAWRPFCESSDCYGRPVPVRVAPDMRGAQSPRYTWRPPTPPHPRPGTPRPSYGDPIRLDATNTTLLGDLAKDALHSAASEQSRSESSDEMQTTQPAPSELLETAPGQEAPAEEDGVQALDHPSLDAPHVLPSEYTQPTAGTASQNRRTFQVL